MNLKAIKKLAKSNKYQILYSRLKEIGSLKLFKNDYDLSKVQDWFLYFLEMYHILYTDLQSNKDYISQAVIDDDMRTEAYLLLRRTENTKNKPKRNKEIDVSNPVPSVVFKRT